MSFELEIKESNESNDSNDSKDDSENSKKINYLHLVSVEDNLDKLLGFYYWKRYIGNVILRLHFGPTFQRPSTWRSPY
jgi:hypothetical protein